MQHLFTYGTLRKGGSASLLMQEATLIQANVTVHGYALYNAGRYPFIKYTGNSEDHVTGDIYKVNEALMKVLKEYEGEEYETVRINEIDAIAFVWNGSEHGYVKIEHGNWIKFVRDKKQMNNEY